MLAAVVDAELLAVHAAVHDALAGRVRGPVAAYLPGAWLPHCVLATARPAEAFAALHPVTPVRAKVTGVAVDTHTARRAHARRGPRARRRCARATPRRRAVGVRRIPVHQVAAGQDHVPGVRSRRAISAICPAGTTPAVASTSNVGQRTPAAPPTSSARAHSAAIAVVCATKQQRPPSSRSSTHSIM